MSDSTHVARLTSHTSQRVYTALRFFWAGTGEGGTWMTIRFRLLKGETAIAR